MKLLIFVVLTACLATIKSTTLIDHLKDRLKGLDEEDYRDDLVKANTKNLSRINQKNDPRTKEDKEVALRYDLEAIEDNVLKEMGSKSNYTNVKARRTLKNRRAGDSFDESQYDYSDKSSSSSESKDWKERWREIWLQKKLDAINMSRGMVFGDTINMVAARPWGVQCGDPRQHDMPWGSCMLPVECDAEYRIYRGDHFCGNTEFICCALQINTYDMYQGFDASLASTSLESTDSSQASEDSDDKRNRDKRRERRRRRRERKKRKRKIKRTITKIVKEIQKILNRMKRNSTTQRKQKTKQLKKFIKELKKQYKQDRKAVQVIHEVTMIKIDRILLNKLIDLLHTNQNFITNSTFREIVVNGSISVKNAMLLARTFPELKPYFNFTRRLGNDVAKDAEKDHDVEYGFLYY